MKKIILCILLVTFISLIDVSKVKAVDSITVYLFHGETCSHCKEGIAYLESIQNDYPDMDIRLYEVWNNDNNAALLDKVKEALGSDSKGVPFFVIGNRYLTGFAEYRKADIISALDYYKNNKKEYEDIVYKVANEEIKYTDKKNQIKYEAVDITKENNEKNIGMIICYGAGIIILSGILFEIKKHRKKE